MQLTQVREITDAPDPRASPPADSALHHLDLVVQAPSPAPQLVGETEAERRVLGGHRQHKTWIGVSTHCASASIIIGNARSWYLDVDGGNNARKISSGPWVSRRRIHLLEGATTNRYRSICESPVADRTLAHLGSLRVTRHHQVNDRRKFFETRIRHHSSLRRPPPPGVRPLVGAVIRASLGARLVTGVGLAPGLGSPRLPARPPAVLLPPEVPPTHEEPPLAQEAAQVV